MILFCLVMLPLTPHERPPPVRLRFCFVANSPRLGLRLRARNVCFRIMDGTWTQSWPRYVRRHAGQNTPLKEIGRTIGVHPGTVGRWFPREGERQQRPDGDQVVSFAREYKRPMVEALIAAGYLCLDDVPEVQVIELQSDFTVQALLDELREWIDSRAADFDDVGDNIIASIDDGLKKRGKRA